MHTLEYDDWVINHNGDFSGFVEIKHMQHDFVLGSMKVPFAILECLVAEKVRRNKIEKIEQMSAVELLEGNEK